MGIITAHKRAGGSLADLQAFKLTVQFGRVNLQRKSPWRARTPGA